MKAFANIQLIPLDGVVRFGRGVDAFGKPYEGLAGFRFVNGEVAEIVGMAKRGDFSRSDHDEIVREFDKIGKRVQYDRRNKDGTFNRRVTVANHPKVGSEKKDKDGKPDQDEVLANAEHFIKLGRKKNKDGSRKLHIIPISENPSPDNPGYDRLTFDRKIDDRD